jgi:hypothetical protein
MNVDIEMPKYKSHKEVWALKINSIFKDGGEADGSAIITPEEEGYAPFKVDADYLQKHNPQVGGYYVVYKDGYKSFSPAEAFEEGNTLIKETNFLDRLIDEEKELSEKTKALSNALKSVELAYKVGAYQYNLLCVQHMNMVAYGRILNMRIDDLQSSKKA